MNTKHDIELGPMQNPLPWWDKTKQEASTLSRWIALYEAVNIIADKAEEKGIKIDDVEFKPLAIHKYMESTENIIFKKILEEQYKIKICYSEPQSEEHSELETEYVD
jgi:hypothetical protein